MEKDEMGGACGMEEKKNACRVFVGVFEGRDHLKELSVVGKMLKWI
jgi:hypothetical protein